MLPCIDADSRQHRREAYRDGVFEEGGAVGGQEGGTPQLSPWVIYVGILVGLPQDSICSPSLVLGQFGSHMTLQLCVLEKSVCSLYDQHAARPPVLGG